MLQGGQFFYRNLSMPIGSSVFRLDLPPETFLLIWETATSAARVPLSERLRRPTLSLTVAIGIYFNARNFLPLWR